jgi:hypothetical protein
MDISGKPVVHLISVLLLITAFISYPVFVYAQVNSQPPASRKDIYLSEQGILDSLRKDSLREYNDLVALKKKSSSQYLGRLLSYYGELRVKENLKKNYPELYQTLQGNLSLSQETAILNYMKANAPEVYNFTTQLKAKSIDAYKNRLLSFKRQIYTIENLKSTQPGLYENSRDTMKMQVIDSSLVTRICQDLSKAKITKKEAEKQLLDILLPLSKKLSVFRQISLVDQKQQLSDLKELAKHSNLPKELIAKRTSQFEASLKFLELNASKSEQDITQSLNNQVANILKRCEQIKRGRLK